MVGRTLQCVSDRQGGRNSCIASGLCAWPSAPEARGRSRRHRAAARLDASCKRACARAPGGDILCSARVAATRACLCWFGHCGASHGWAFCAHPSWRDHQRGRALSGGQPLLNTSIAAGGGCLLPGAASRRASSPAYTNADIAPLHTRPPPGTGRRLARVCDTGLCALFCCTLRLVAASPDHARYTAKPPGCLSSRLPERRRTGGRYPAALCLPAHPSATTCLAHLGKSKSLFSRAHLCPPPASHWATKLSMPASEKHGIRQHQVQRETRTQHLLLPCCLSPSLRLPSSAPCLPALLTHLPRALCLRSCGGCWTCMALGRESPST